MIAWVVVAHAADFAVDLRAIGTAPSAFPTSTEDELVWGPALDGRLRTALLATRGPYRLALASDFFTGQWAGATWNQPAIDERGRDTRDALTLAGIVPREAMVGVRTRLADVALGLQTSHWGLGLVANSGAEDPLFGRSDFGDRVLRLRVATQLIGYDRATPGLFVVLAGDRVVADELARWSQGDEAYQAVFATFARAQNGSDAEAGVYGVYRSQRSAEERLTQVGVFDGYARLPLPRGFALEGEGALLWGHTDALRTTQAPEGVPVRAGGLAVRALAGSPEGPLWAQLRLAVASGDAAADDDTFTEFRFDRDHDVGFVLFDEFSSALDLGAWQQAVDPTVAALPPDGVDGLATEGAFSKAAALQPIVEAELAEWLTVRVGTVFAWSTGPIGQSFATFRNGGVPANAWGIPTSGRYLGTELDWAVVIDGSSNQQRRAELMVGHAWPSADFGGPVGRVDHALLVVRLGFSRNQR